MKKFFTLFLLGFSIVAGAQTLTFSHEGKTIDNGTTFTSGNIYEDPLGDLFQIPDEVRPQIFLNCSSNETIVCVVEDVDRTGGVKFCFGGDCQVSGTNGIYTIEKEYAFQGTALDIQLDFVLPLTGYGTGRTIVTAWVKGKEETTKVSIQVVMSNDPEILSSVLSVDAQNEVTIYNKTLYYHLASDGNRSLTIYGLNGVQVMNASLNTANGSVDLSELPKGVYIYRLVGKDVDMQRKFILK
ncbi:MAG: T9SS type A sorting domain-containing protein [Paraprevotella sp.]|nr:T9SS type A sorting domain-containing protein [Paraprevotella sp.]